MLNRKTVISTMALLVVQGQARGLKEMVINKDYESMMFDRLAQMTETKEDKP